MNNIKRLFTAIALFNIIATFYVLFYHVDKVKYYVALICLYVLYLILIKSFQGFSRPPKS